MNFESTEKDLIRLQNERESYITKLFWFALEIALIFLVPALITVFLLMEFFSKKAAIYSLPFTFVFSWVIIIIRWKKINKVLTGLDKQISELKKQQKHVSDN
jgi:hypothetical protein